MSQCSRCSITWLTLDNGIRRGFVTSLANIPRVQSLATRLRASDDMNIAEFPRTFKGISEDSAFVLEHPAALRGQRGLLDSNNMNEQPLLKGLIAHTSSNSIMEPAQEANRLINVRNEDRLKLSERAHELKELSMKHGIMRYGLVRSRMGDVESVVEQSESSHKACRQCNQSQSESSNLGNNRMDMYNSSSQYQCLTEAIDALPRLPSFITRKFVDLSKVHETLSGSQITGDVQRSKRIIHFGNGLRVRHMRQASYVQNSLMGNYQQARLFASSTTSKDNAQIEEDMIPRQGKFEQQHQGTPAGTSRSQHPGRLSSGDTMGRYHARQSNGYFPTVSGRSDVGDDFLYSDSYLQVAAGQSSVKGTQLAQQGLDPMLGLMVLPEDMYDYDAAYETLNRLGQKNAENLFGVAEALLERTDIAFREFVEAQARIRDDKERNESQTKDMNLNEIGAELASSMAFSADATGVALADMFNETIESALYLKAYNLAFGLFNAMRLQFGLLPSSYVYASITHVDMREKVNERGALAESRGNGAYSTVNLRAGPSASVVRLKNTSIGVDIDQHTSLLQSLPESLQRFKLFTRGIEVNANLLPNPEIEEKIMGCGIDSLVPAMRTWTAPGLTDTQDSNPNVTRGGNATTTRLATEDYLDLVCDDLGIEMPKDEFVRELVQFQNDIDPLAVSTWSVDLIRTCPIETWQEVGIYFMLFAEMRRHSIQPDSVFYNMLLRSCAETGLWRPALGLVQEMALSSFFLRSYSYLLVRMNAQVLCHRALENEAIKENEDEIQKQLNVRKGDLIISNSANAALALSAGHSEEAALAMIRSDADNDVDFDSPSQSKMTLYSSVSRPPFVSDPQKAQRLVNELAHEVATQAPVPLPEGLRKLVQSVMSSTHPAHEASLQIQSVEDPALSNWIIEIIQRIADAGLITNNTPDDVQKETRVSSTFTPDEIAQLTQDKHALEQGMVPPTVFERTTLEALGSNAHDDTPSRTVWGFALLPDVYTFNMLLQTLAAAKQPYLSLSLLETWFRDTKHGNEYIARYGEITKHGKVREAADSGDTGAANIFHLFNPDGTRREGAEALPTSGSLLRMRLSIEAGLRLNPNDAALREQLLNMQSLEKLHATSLAADESEDTDTVRSQLPQTALISSVDEALNRVQIPGDANDISKWDQGSADSTVRYRVDANDETSVLPDTPEIRRQKELWGLTAQEQVEYDSVSTPEAVIRAADATRKALETERRQRLSDAEKLASEAEKSARDAEASAEVAFQHAEEMKAKLAQLDEEDPLREDLKNKVSSAVQLASTAVELAKEKAKIALQLAAGVKAISAELSQSKPPVGASVNTGRDIGSTEAVDLASEAWTEASKSLAPQDLRTQDDDYMLTPAGLLSFHEKQLQRSLARSNFSVTARTGIDWWNRSFELCVPTVLPDPTSLSYGIVFMSLIDHQDYAQALDLACRMLLRDHPQARPDANMLNWCCRSAREVNDWERAFWIIDTTRRLDIKPLPTSYINALASCVEPDSIFAETAALRILAYAKRDGVPITVSMYTTVIAAMKSWRHAVALLMELHDTMNLPALVMPYTAAVHVCTKCGKLSSAYKLIMYAKSKGLPKNDIQVLFETLLDAATKYKYSADVHQLLQRLRDQQVDVTPRVMAALMRVSRNSEDFNSALKLYGTGLLQNRLNLLVFSSLIQVFTRSRAWGEAAGVFIFYDFMTRNVLSTDLEWNPEFRFDYVDNARDPNNFIENLSQAAESAEKLADLGVHQLLLRLTPNPKKGLYRNEDISLRLDAARVFTVLSVLHWTLSAALRPGSIPPWIASQPEEARGAIELPEPDVRLYNDGALALVRARQPEAGLEVYRFLASQSGPLSPTPFTYDMLVAALYQTSRVVEAVKLYREGIERGSLKPSWKQSELVIDPSKHSIFTAVLSVRVTILDLLRLYRAIPLPSELYRRIRASAKLSRGKKGTGSDTDEKGNSKALDEMWRESRAIRLSSALTLLPGPITIVCGTDTSPNLPMLEAIEWSLGHRYPRKVSSYRGTVDGRRLSGALILPRDELIDWLEDIVNMNLSEEHLYCQHNFTRSEMRAKRDRIEQRLALRAVTEKVNVEFREDGSISQKISKGDNLSTKQKTYEELETQRQNAAKAWNFTNEAVRKSQRSRPKPGKD